MLMFVSVGTLGSRPIVTMAEISGLSGKCDGQEFCSKSGSISKWKRRVFQEISEMEIHSNLPYAKGHIR